MQVEFDHKLILVYKYKDKCITSYHPKLLFLIIYVAVTRLLINSIIHRDTGTSKVIKGFYPLFDVWAKIKYIEIFFEKRPRYTVESVFRVY